MIRQVRCSKKKQKKAASKLYDNPGKNGSLGSGQVRKQTIERKIQLSSSTPVDTLFDKYIDLGTPVTINFYADDEGCLGEHSYVVQSEIGYYSVNLVGDLKNVVKPSSPIEDPRKCLYRHVGRKNNEYAVLDMFEDIRKAGSVKNFEVTVFEKVDVTPPAPISVEKPKPKRNIFQKLVKQSGEVKLILIPKKEIYFDNSPGFFEQMIKLFESIKQQGMPKDTKATTIVPWINQIRDKFKKSLKPRFGKEMDYILYSPKTEYVLTLRQTGYSITQTSRNDTYGSLFLDNMSDIIEKMPPLGDNAAERSLDKRLRKALIKILEQMADKLKGSNESNNFTKKELLDQINQSIYSNPTAFIDFDNSSVTLAGKNPISLTRYLLGRKSLGIISVSLQQGFMSSLSSDEYKNLSKSVQDYNQQDYTQYKLVVARNTYEFSNTYGGKQQVDKGVIHGLQTLTNNSDIKSTVNNVMLAYQKGLDRSKLNESFFNDFQDWYNKNGTYGTVAIGNMKTTKQADVISKIKNTKDKDIQQSLKEDLIKYASQKPLYIFGNKEIPELKVILARGVTGGGEEYTISESDLTKLPVNKGAFVTGRAFVANPSIQQALVQNGTRFGFKELGGGVWIMDPKWAEKFRNANLKGGADKLFKSSVDDIKGLSPVLNNSLKRIEKYFYAIKKADKVKIDYSKEDLNVEVNGNKLLPADVFSTLMKGIAEDQVNPGRVFLSTDSYDNENLADNSKVFYDVGKSKGCKPRVGAEFKFSCKTISLANKTIEIKTGTKVFIDKCGDKELNGGRARVQKIGDNTYKISACASKTKIIKDNLLRVPENVTFDTTPFIPETVPGDVEQKLEIFLDNLDKVNPAKRITDNDRTKISSDLVKTKLGKGRVDRGFYNALLHMKDQMKNDGVKDWEKFEVGGGKMSSFRTPEQARKNFENALNRNHGKKICNASETKKDAIIKDAIRKQSNTVAPAKGNNKYTINCKGKDNKVFMHNALQGSGHQTGRVADFAPFLMSSKDENVNADKSTAIWQWLNKNAQKFGFIPYPSEPWHWEMSPANAKKWRNFKPHPKLKG